MQFPGLTAVVFIAASVQRGTICGEDQEGALPLALKYMESEQKRLELHKLAARIQMETNPCPVAYQEVNLCAQPLPRTCRPPQRKRLH